MDKVINYILNMSLKFWENTKWGYLKVAITDLDLRQKDKIQIFLSKHM